MEGIRCRYHLRSQSGSNGPIAKETSPLLGWRPILNFRRHCDSIDDVDENWVLPAYQDKFGRWRRPGKPRLYGRPYQNMTTSCHARVNLSSCFGRRSEEHTSELQS